MIIKSKSIVITQPRADETLDKEKKLNLKLIPAIHISRTEQIQVTGNNRVHKIASKVQSSVG
jgi:hypothetical protein